MFTLYTYTEKAGKVWMSVTAYQPVHVRMYFVAYVRCQVEVDVKDVLLIHCIPLDAPPKQSSASCTVTTLGSV